VGDVELRLTELERRLSNLLRLGTVEQLDEDAARIKVRCGDLLTSWLPWFTRRAGEDRDWWAPEEGEQVMVLSPCGEPSIGVALPAVYRDAYPAPANKKTVWRRTFADGTVIEYDRASHKLYANVVGGTIDARADVSAIITSPLVKAVAATKVVHESPLTEMTGNLSVAGGITCLGSYGASGGKIQTPGDIESTGGDVKDKVRALNEDRAIYNGHDHPGDSGGTTGPPNQDM